MEVQLYVYDLSGGIARVASASLLGIQIDAVYHTSIVMEGIEYVYDGGIKTIAPGSSHLGRPMQIIRLGKTDLPMDVILEYLDSLKEIFTAEAYDLWTHNCNNFSNDFATFLLGKGIPDHITNLPETVLNTPFGQMLQPQINNMVREKKERHGGILGLQSDNNTALPATHPKKAEVKHVSSMLELEEVLEGAAKTCAVIFFTSPTCRPCLTLYPLFDDLAAQAGNKGVFIKVDVSKAYDVGTKYSISGTPTFITFIHGEQENRWSGADPSTLRGNVQMLLQMAWPPHPHDSLYLPELRRTTLDPIFYSKIPPLDKLKAKMGPSASNPAIVGLMGFVSARSNEGAAEATLPNLGLLTNFIHTSFSQLPQEIMFTVVDLLRVALVDPRLSGYYAEEKDHKTVSTLITYVNSLENCPYSLRLVTIQMACNLYSSPLYPRHILSCQVLATPIIQLITTSLLDDKHHNLRVAAASLSFNIASTNYKIRLEDQMDLLPEGEQVELAASLLEAISVEEESSEAIRGFILALGYLVYCCPKNSELIDLLKTMDAQSVVMGKTKAFPKEPLLKEIGQELLGKGL
ncbi:PPPDE putative peptidase domain-containing protein [Xylogone sp. PMI_703]|nr:PPPDE putative peptidase domain-containing protein [Xylogone sp. PMI_703]